MEHSTPNESIFEGAGPGDSGPCPICGEEMAEKEYPIQPCFGPFPRRIGKIKGRYWHMLNEHQIWEKYQRKEY